MDAKIQTVEWLDKKPQCSVISLYQYGRRIKSKMDNNRFNKVKNTLDEFCRKNKRGKYCKDWFGGHRITCENCNKNTELSNKLVDLLE